MRTGKVAALAVVLLSTASAATPLRPNRQPDAAAILVTEGTISSIQSALRQRRVSCVEIVTAYLERIARPDRMRGLNAITTLIPKRCNACRVARSTWKSACAERLHSRL